MHVYKEGALGGFACGSILSLIGAYLMRWPYWQATGLLYGLMISFIALVGDLTASMMKRDAGLKDSGNILPGHGGLLDRIDSYMLNGPIAYFFCIKVYYETFLFTALCIYLCNIIII